MRDVEAFRETLARCGVPCHDVAIVGEYGRTTPVGIEIVRGFLLTVEGRGYDVVTVDPWLPEAEARILNDRPCAIVGAGNSGDGGTLGSVARAYGNGGGTPTHAIRGGVETWHCDRPAATVELVALVRKYLVSLDVDEVRYAKRRWKTESIVAEFQALTGLSPYMQATLREGLETMADINRDDPRVQALIAGWT